MEVTYEPEQVELTGKLTLQTFPGPPNFESIKGGDAIERHFYLKLDRPIDVLPLPGGHPTVSNPELERNVKIIQLSIDAEDNPLWAKFRKVGRNARVKILGTLFHRFTGHHHSRILLIVKKMDTLKISY
jgi:Domain of unknown function (DUF4431)